MFEKKTGLNELLVANKRATMDVIFREICRHNERSKGNVSFQLASGQEQLSYFKNGLFSLHQVSLHQKIQTGPHTRRQILQGDQDT